MKLLVGLGNPGPEYARTRHNMGFWVLDRVAQELGVGLTRRAFHGKWAEYTDVDLRLGLLKPQGYMNCSGEAVKACAQYWKVDPADILIVHDDLDVRLGQVKMAHDRGSAGHNGVQSVVDHLKTRSFWRLRTGIDRPTDGTPGVEYVLRSFPKAQRESVEAAVQWAAKAVQVWYRHGADTVMQQFHGRRENGVDL